MLATGCAPSSLPDAQDGPFYDDPAELYALNLQCADDLWRIDVETIHWTGGARLWIARDEEVWEKHAITSDVAAGNGAWDCLLLELAVEADWRDAVSGSTTRFTCSEAAALSFQLAVLETGGDERTACTAWGTDPELFDQIEDIDACEPLVSDVPAEPAECEFP